MSFAKPLQLIALRQSYAARTNRAAALSALSSNVTSNQTIITSCRTSNQSFIQTRQYSRTNTVQVFGWMRDKWEQSEKTNQAAKLVDQIALMANTEVWTAKMFKDEVDETLSSWKTKIPGMGGTAQIQAAKDTQKVVTQLVAQMGGDATAKDVSEMGRKEKLNLAIACEMTMEEINAVLGQFRNMELMHRILRYRKLNGLELPKDAEGLKMAMQKDGMKILTSAEKKAASKSMKSQMQR